MTTRCKVLVDKHQLRHRLAVSLRTFDRWMANGLVPKPIKRGRIVRWDPEIINAWIDAGCPSAEEFEQMRREGRD